MSTQTTFPEASVKGFFTKAEAHLYTGLATRTLDYAVASGELRAYRCGRRVLFAREDLDAFVRRTPVNADLARIAAEAVDEVLGSK